ncbi:MAG: hypothetical protein KA436_04490 [Oligoflexales bacterium]|nr:hypothetical protein [Oligoflexales bacterium]
MAKKLLLFIILAMTSSLSYAGILLPTFYADPTTRIRYGEQHYHSDDPSGILWQLRYWSHNQLHPSALSQALNDILSNRGKFSGTVNLGALKYNLYHSSAGKDEKTATLFFILEQEFTRIIGIARHVQVQPRQPPKYEIVAWDDRYPVYY